MANLAMVIGGAFMLGTCCGIYTGQRGSLVIRDLYQVLVIAYIAMVLGIFAWLGFQMVQVTDREVVNDLPGIFVIGSMWTGMLLFLGIIPTAVGGVIGLALKSSLPSPATTRTP